MSQANDIHSVVVWLTVAIAASLPVSAPLADELCVFELTVTNRQAPLANGPIRVKEGDMVELRMTSDEEGELDLHGYDVEIELRAREITVTPFKAHVAGRFPITSHGFGPSGDRARDPDHVTLFYLEVYPRRQPT